MILPASSRIQEILAASKGKRILIVGDLMLDRFIFGDVERISPEAPVPVVRVDREISMPGGAANVAINIASLGGEPVLGGLIGEDPAGSDLREVLIDRGVDISCVLTEPKHTTIVKTRVIAERQQVCRVDRENPGSVSDTMIHDLITSVENHLETVDAVIIEDYGKGCIQQALLDRVIAACQTAGKPVAFDPKELDNLTLSGITIATPNLKEAIGATGIAVEKPVVNGSLSDELKEVGKALLERWGAEMVCVTLGPDGMSLFQRDTEPAHVDTHAREVFDVSGAGDTVVAAAALFIAGGATGAEAAALANGAAGVVVGKVGTATCSADELGFALNHEEV